jgi:hypothetical protein
MHRQTFLFGLAFGLRGFTFCTDLLQTGEVNLCLVSLALDVKLRPVDVSYVAVRTQTCPPSSTVPEPPSSPLLPWLCNRYEEAHHEEVQKTRTVRAAKVRAVR